MKVVIQMNRGIHLDYLGGSKVIAWDLKVGKRDAKEPGQSDLMGGELDPLLPSVKVKEDGRKQANESSH